MIKNLPFVDVLQQRMQSLRRQTAVRLYDMNDLQAAFASYSDAKKIGEDLANILERRPIDCLDIINNRVAAYQFLAHLGNIVRALRIDFVIDAGAHSGQFASTLYGYGQFQGEVHSFEPVKKFYDVMVNHVDYYKGWKAYNAALGDEPGISQIFIGKGHGGTSSLLPQTDNLATFAPDCQLGETQEITVYRVDEMFGEVLADPSRRVMLKLDVQGFEERVLRSAGRYVENLKLVQMELSGVPLYQGQGSLGYVCKMMEDFGFSLIYTCNSFGIKGSVFIDFDFIFCRRSDLEAMKLS